MIIGNYWIAVGIVNVNVENKDCDWKKLRLRTMAEIARYSDRWWMKRSCGKTLD